MRAFLLIAALSGCTWTQADRATLALATATVACDGLQTTKGALAGWRAKEEGNPLLHDRSPEFVATYFVASEAALIAAWYFLPPRWRSGFGVVVTGAEIPAIVASQPGAAWDPGSTNKYYCW